MPEPEYEQELGPRVADAFQSRADTVRGSAGRAMAAEARRRVRKRRQSMVTAAAAVVVVVAIGGVWGAVGGPSPVGTTAADSSSAGGAGSANAPEGDSERAGCSEQHPILTAGISPPAGTGLDLESPVFGLQACRYRLAPGEPMLLGSGSFNATEAQQIVDAIKVLPEHNPDLPVFKCAPEAARPAEAIVLRFDTATGVREVWVHYDGCAAAGFFTGSRTYGLYPEPLKLFMTGTLRPAGGMYLDHLDGW